MPIFEYRCKSCGNNYDVFHHTKEIADDIICPNCNSKESEKLISAFSASMGSEKAQFNSPPPDCSSCCSGGNCGMNYN